MSEILIKLRSEWIKERDKFPQGSRQWDKLHFGVYALDEAIESLKARKVWRYTIDRNISLDVVLNRREPVSADDGNLFEREKTDIFS